jgi:poly(beta-D-mannuronate) lyase
MTRNVAILCLPHLLAWISLTASSLAEEPPPLGNFLRGLLPGKTVEVPDGTYTTEGHRVIQGLQGTEGQPVILRAAHRGKVVIVGEAGLVLRDCEHVVIEGFVFHNDADQQSVQLENCRHVQVSRNIFQPKERDQPRHWEHWVTVDGAHSGSNRIDHNLFDHKVNRGSPLFIRGDDTALVCSQHDRIDHNHFRDVIYANGENGHETIRTGGNDLGASGQSSFTVIESNLLERCSGEDEIISLKSSDNVVRNNTFINCRGAICFRLGNRSEASGNIMIATEEGPSFGGIKLFGFEHRVLGNYFAGLTGRKHEAPFSLFPGMYAEPTTDNIGRKYDDATAAAATRCRIANNTWVDCTPLQFGLEVEDKKWKQAPKDCVFVNNLIVRTKPFSKPIVNLGLTGNTQAKDNRFYTEQAQPDAAWMAWFHSEKEKPPVTMPQPLTTADVGPDAP